VKTFSFAILFGSLSLSAFAQHTEEGTISSQENRFERSEEIDTKGPLHAMCNARYDIEGDLNRFKECQNAFENYQGSLENLVALTCLWQKPADSPESTQLMAAKQCLKAASPHSEVAQNTEAAASQVKTLQDLTDIYTRQWRSYKNTPPAVSKLEQRFESGVLAVTAVRKHADYLWWQNGKTPLKLNKQQIKTFLDLPKKSRENYLKSLSKNLS
jgi:hypothetical protein